MKIRQGFVSNSSSSSFILKKKNLSKLQIEQIFNHIDIAEQMAIETNADKNEYGYEYYGLFEKNDAWRVKEMKAIIYCDCGMNNFDLDEFIKDKFGIKDEDFYDIHIGDYYFYEDEEIERIDNKLNLEITKEKIKQIKGK